MTLLLLYAGATAGTLPDLTANAAGFFTLTGHATAETEQDREYIPGGAGREEFQPRAARPRPLITASAAASLILRGKARSTVTPVVAHAGVQLPAPRPAKARPPEEEREFRILATASGRVELHGGAEGASELHAESWSDLEIGGGSSAETSWPDDTDELVCLMLMLDQEAA